VKIHTIVFGFVAITAAGLACHSTDVASIQTPPLAVSDASIELSEGSCNGSCPEYSFVVSADGSLRWKGVLYVMAIGERRATLDA
jgi:hypothetical protein